MGPFIKMKAATDKPVRKAGKVYAVTGEEGWELVRTGQAEWVYVPEKEQAAVTDKEVVKAVAKKTAGTTE